MPYNCTSLDDSLDSWMAGLLAEKAEKIPPILGLSGSRVEAIATGRSVDEVIRQSQLRCGGRGKRVRLAVSCGGGLILVLVLSSSLEAEVSCLVGVDSPPVRAEGNSTRPLDLLELVLTSLAQPDRVNKYHR